MAKFNWYTSTQYNDSNKRKFHSMGRARLRQLAAALELPVGSYAIRSNQGGIAVSGEVILHSDHLYVQVSQPFGGADTGIMYRRCNGRADYHGGRNWFDRLELLDDIEELANHIECACGPCYKPNANEVKSQD